MKITKTMQKRLAQIILEHIINAFRDDKRINQIELQYIINGHSIDTDSGEIKLNIPILEQEKNLWRRRVHKKKYHKNTKSLGEINRQFEKTMDSRREIINSLLSESITEWELEFGIGTEVF